MATQNVQVVVRLFKPEHLVILFLLVASVAGCDLHIDRRTTANETVTLQNVRKVRSRLLAYRDGCGGFPATLGALNEQAASSLCNAKTAPLVGGGVVDRELLQALSSGPVSGYRYVYLPTVPLNTRSTLFSRFTLQASPVEPGVTGEASFLADDSADVKRVSKGP